MLADAIQYTQDHQTALLQDDRFAELLVHLGNRLLDADRVEQAVTQYQLALKLDPQLGAAHLNLAVARIKQRQFAAAEQSLVQAIRVRADDPRAHYQLGALLLQTQRLPQALEHLQRAAQLRPNDRQYRLALATAGAAAGNWSLAASQLEVALLADSRDAAAWAQLASIRLRQEQHAEAIRCFRQALGLRPDWPSALDSLAWLLATVPNSDLRDAAQAVQLAERACQLEGNPHPKRLDTLAAAYAAAGRFADAVRTAERAEQLARSGQQDRLAAGIAQRLKAYRAGRPLVP